MPNLDRTLLVWTLFFITTVYGHIGLKIAMHGAHPENYSAQLVSFWGISSFLSWVISGLIWAAILSDQSLTHANAISALRYVLIALAAYLFLSEKVDIFTLIGSGLIVSGIYLIAYAQT
ncbi:EamA family transporter [bacterium]|nr:EamA family transporter [bacterium]